MTGEFLTQILILLAGSLLVLSLVRRFRLPPILGYLVVGMLLGPHSLGLVSNDESIRLLAEIGVVFLVFTLGLEFSLARMVAMKSEVLGVGGLQVLLCGAAFGGMAYASGIEPGPSVVIGGALAMSSTAIVLRQLGDQLELARTHARLALGILLFQDLAFAPLLGLATALGSGDVPGPAWLLGMAGRAAVALLVVLVFGRFVARPLFREISRHRSTETFTLTVLFVSLGAAWATHRLGLSMALGGFLAGMLLAETEFKHQTEAVIKPFHDILLGVFFVSVGMLLDLRELLAQLPLVLLVLVVLLVTKTVIVSLVVRRFVPNDRKALRTGIVVSMGGEFGFALITLLLRGPAVEPRIVQVLLTAIALSMLLGPLIVRYNKSVADRILRRNVATPSDMALETVATRDVATREHIIVCGFGRVGQNLARILERGGFEFVGLDSDLLRVRDARMAGDPVVYGDATHPEVLRTLGLERASVIVLTFNAPETALRIVREVRRLRADVPLLVRTEDDGKLDALQAAGATEVIPDTFESSLALASHLLLFLKVPATDVLATTEQVRHERYAILRSVFRRRDVARLPVDGKAPGREQLYTVVLPPGAKAVDRSIEEVGLDRGPVTVSAIRREGITGRHPGPETRLREGDVLVLWGRPEDLEQVESRLLMG
ncbi:MAG TPA: cation:proton antiporter [Steroidobacteraceae bacterium]|nr:cation:proton antiporter [Steroidobacteraceae bacterium]